MKLENIVNRFNLKRFYSVQAISLVFALVLAISIVSAQKTQSTDHKADSNLKSSARVNPSTLAMELSIPLFSYPGRAGNSMPVVFNYSSKVWKMNRFNFHREVNQVNNGSYNYEVKLTSDLFAKYSERTISGWTSSLLPPVIIDEAEIYNQFGELYRLEIPQTQQPLVPPGNECFCTPTGAGWRFVMSSLCSSGVFFGEEYRCTCSDGGGVHEVYTTYVGDCLPPVGGSPTPSPTPVNPNEPVPPPELQYQHIVPRVRVQMPDGSSHEFRKEDKAYDCGSVFPPPSQCNESKEGLYLSVDGSGMRLYRGEVQPNTNNEKRDVLYMPDGSRYLFSVQSQTPSYERYLLAEQFIDENGNKMSYDLEDRTWTDTMARPVNDPMPNPFLYQSPSEDTQTVQLPGLDGGSNRNYQFVWKKLKPAGCEDSTSSCNSEVLENPNQALSYTGEDSCASTASNSTNPSLFSRIEDINEHTETYNGNVIKYFEKNRVCTSFNGTNVARFNPVVLSEIVLPNQTKYQFKYNVYGEITKIIYPTGGYERFEYGQIDAMGASFTPDYDQVNRGVKKRWVSFDGTNETQEWNYDAALSGNTYTVSTIAPDGSKSERVLYYASDSSFGFEDPRSGVPLEEKVYSTPDTNGQRQLLRRTLTEWITAPPRDEGQAYVNPLARRDPRPSRSLSIIFENGAALATLSESIYDDDDYSESPEYFAHLNVKEARKYHFAAISLTDAQATYTPDTTQQQGLFSTLKSTYFGDKLATISQTDYLYDSAYKARNINGLVLESRVLDPQNNVISKTQPVYDNSTLLTYSSSPSTWVDPGANTKRGLVTGSKVWLNTLSGGSGGWLETRTQYDQFGNVRYAWDAKAVANNQLTAQYAAQIEYSSIKQGTSVDYYAYPTKAIAPAPDPTGTNGTTEKSEVTTTYDFNTGLPLTVTNKNVLSDSNDDVTVTTEYNDSLLRPTRTFVTPSGYAGETLIEYGDSIGNLYVKTKTQIDANNYAESTQYFDALGRVVKARMKDNSGDVFTETQYDVMSRVWKVSNPFRTSETPIWTTTTYDDLGRIAKVTTPDNAEVKTSFALSTSGSYIGTLTTVEDQAGKKRRSLVDALGRLIRVDEPKADTGELDVSGSPYQSTFYTYDILGNLRTVTQGEQKRYFLYDSLSRLIRARNPEQGVNSNINLSSDSFTENINQWSVAYSYDSNGNLLSKTDAKNITTSYGYDALNRVITRGYSDNTTPNVDYFYDGKGLGSVPANSKGKLTKVSCSVSETRYTGFDAVGRITQSEQATDGVTYPISYTYNLSGGLISETYPSGRVVTNSFDSNGKLSAVQSNQSNQTARMYANSFSYTSSGAIERLRLGNGKWETTAFNTRLQPVKIGLGSSATDTSLLKLVYDYGQADNNGSVKSQTITAQDLTHPYIQTYTYDSLNRLKSATETSNNQQTWKQTYLYDRYGNRNFDTSNTTNPNTQQTIEAVFNPTIETTTNRFASNQGYLYDASGNVIQDATGKKFVYNAENKQTSFGTSGSETNGGLYVYDGSGQRIKKTVVTTSETTIFIYDASGKMVAEYTNQTQQGTPETRYLTADMLGTPRIITNQSGQVKERHDYMPFGEEITSNSESKVRQKYTGYEKDSESGLDYAKARYYGNTQGRFNSPDPYVIFFEIERGQDKNEETAMLYEYLGQPQNWNKYVYCLNSPLKHTDPNGMRPKTKEEIEAIKRLNQFADEADKAGNAELATGYRNAAEEISALIDGIKSNRDPANMGIWVAVNAILNIGNKDFSDDGTAKFGTKKFPVKIGPGYNKCNVFCAFTHTNGAGKGLTKDTAKLNGRGYPYTDHGLPSANELGSKNRQLSNLEIITNGIKIGDIVAWRHKWADSNPDKYSGHSAIYIGGGVIVYAGGAGVNGYPTGTPQGNLLKTVDYNLTNSMKSYVSPHLPYVVRRYNGKP